MQGQQGLESVSACLPEPTTPNDFAVIIVWRDLDSLRAFVGEDWRTPHIHPDEAGLVAD